METRRNNELIVAISIILGITAFVVSVIIFRTNINPYNGKVKLILGEETKYIEGISGSVDTVFLRGLQDYLQKLQDTVDYKLIKEGDSIFQSVKYQSKYIPSLAFELKNKADSNLIDLQTHINTLDKKYKDFENKERYFINRNPRLIIWSILMSIAIGFSCFLIPTFIYETTKYASNLSKLKVISIIGFSLFILFLLVIPQLWEEYLEDISFLIYPKDLEPVLNYGLKPFGLLYNFSLPFVGIVFWLILIFCINASISKCFEEKSNSLSTKIEEIQNDFEKYFMVIAIYLAYTLISNNILLNALNNLVKGAASNKFNFFPIEFSFINGLLQTFFLVILYLGISSNFNYIKRELNKSSSPENVFAEKGFLDYLKVILAILAPILGSGIQELIGSIF